MIAEAKAMTHPVGTMMRYRKKPVEIDAFRLGDEWPDWWADKVNAGEIVTSNDDGRWRGGPDVAHIKTLEGIMRAEKGDWIIKGVKGEIYPCKPDIFAATYEPVEPASPMTVGTEGKFTAPTDEKRYRECVAEIVGVLKKYDMAGAITVVDKERFMFKYYFPTWTCVVLREDNVRLRSKREDFPSREAQHKANELTAHTIMQIRDVAANTFAMCEHLAEKMREAWGMEHTPNVDFDPERSN